MKNSLKIMLLCVFFLPLSMTVAAEEDKGEHAEHSMHAGGKMSPERLQAMQAHILAMHDLSNKILAEKDPKKQQALKDQQLELMKAHMAEKIARHQEHLKAKADAKK